MNLWNIVALTDEDLKPRQFEYHPSGNELLIGTLTGQVYTLKLNGKDSLADSPLTNIGLCGEDDRDVILGLCWLKTYPDR